MDSSDLDAFYQQLKDPAATQAATLARILRRARRSAFGRAHGFESIETVDDYRARVPLASFQELATWQEKDPTGLTGQRPLWFFSTSSTTGVAKMIPCTKDYEETVGRAHGLFTLALWRDYPWMPLVGDEPPRALAFYQIASSGEYFHRVPVNSLASRFFDVALPEDPFFRSTPRELAMLSDSKLRIYGGLVLGAGFDIRCLRATNSTTLLLVARILRESSEALIADLAAGRFAAPELQAAAGFALTARPEIAARLRALGRPLTPRDLWPGLELLATWRGGPSSRYEEMLREHFGDVAIRGLVYSSSEGHIAIPLSGKMTGGVASITSSYLEFFRPGEEERPLGVHQLEVGGQYEVVITSPAGMYRYRIGDIVEVDGMCERTPTLRFVERTGTSSLTGEKLTDLQAQQAVDGALREHGVQAADYVLSGQVAERPSYVLSIEPRPGTEAALASARDRVARTADELLQGNNVEYKSKRESGRLAPIAVRIVRRGGFDELVARATSSARAGVFKLPKVTPKPLHEQLPLEEP
jgi:hypothetical protein